MNALRTARRVVGWILLAWIAPSATLAAQTHVPTKSGIAVPKPVGASTLYPSHRHALTSLAGPDLEELDFGTFFGNEERTLCVLASGQLIEIHDPSVFDIESLEISLGGVTSAAALPSSAAGGAANLFAADVDGLSDVPGDLSWVFQEPLELRGRSWAEAEELQALREDGLSVLLGVTADRLSVRMLADLGTGWVNGPTLATGEEILDVVALDFDGDGILEIATLGPSGVRVQESNGTVAAYFPAEWTGGGELERVRGDGELLAWTTLDGDENPVLLLLGESTADDPLALELPIVAGQGAQPLDVAAMTAGDLNGDGLDDLVLTDYSSHRAVLLWNRGVSGAHFAAGLPGTDHYLVQLLSPVSTPGTGNDCAPLVADLDGNDRQDLAFGLDTTGEVLLFLSVPPPSAPAIAALLSNGWAVSATSYFSEANCEPPDTSSSCTEGVLNLAFDLTQQIVNSFDYVEVIVWRQPLQGGEVDPLSVSHTLHAFYGAPPRSGHQWIKVTIPETWVVWPAGEHYWVRYRFCRADVVPVPPVILGATPSFVTGLTLRHTGSYGWPPLTLDDSDFDYLEAQAGGFGFLMADLPFPDSSAAGLVVAPRSHLGFIGGSFPLILGNAYVGAFYSKVKIPPPPAGGGLETTVLVLVSGQQIPW